MPRDSTDCWENHISRVLEGSEFRERTSSKGQLVRVLSLEDTGEDR